MTSRLWFIAGAAVTITSAFTLLMMDQLNWLSFIVGGLSGIVFAFCETMREISKKEPSQ